MNYDQSDYAAMSLRTWVNIIYGKMTSIDRRKKQVIINNQKVLPYDHLILCTGEQYYHIAPMKNKVYNAYAKQEVKPYLGRPLFDQPPPNMFVVNGESDAENLLAYMEKNHLASSKDNVIFYGLDLNVLCTIQSIISFGIDPKRIVIFCEKNVSEFKKLAIFKAERFIFILIGDQVFQ